VPAIVPDPAASGELTAELPQLDLMEPLHNEWKEGGKGKEIGRGNGKQRKKGKEIEKVPEIYSRLRPLVDDMIYLTASTKDIKDRQRDNLHDLQ